MKLYQKEHKLGNAKRAFAAGLKAFKGGLGFRQTQTGQALVAKVKRCAARLALFLALACLTFSASAQTTNAPASPKFLDSLKDLGSSLGNATNYSFAPYVTYAPDAPRKFGAGLSITYDVTDNVGVGSDIDWLGSFQLVNGNVTLKHSFRPLQAVGWTNLVATPVGTVGLGTPLGGADNDNGNVATVAGAGLILKLATVKGWDLSTGYMYKNWTGAGEFSGNHHSVMFQFSKGI